MKKIINFLIISIFKYIYSIIQNFKKRVSEINSPPNHFGLIIFLLTVLKIESQSFLYLSSVLFVISYKIGLLPDINWSKNLGGLLIAMQSRSTRQLLVLSLKNI